MQAYIHDADVHAGRISIPSLLGSAKQAPRNQKRVRIQRQDDSRLSPQVHRQGAGAELDRAVQRGVPYDRGLIGRSIQESALSVDPSPLRPFEANCDEEPLGLQKPDKYIDYEEVLDSAFRGKLT